MNLILTSPPQQEPVSLLEAKKWLRIDGADEDDLISSMITAARALVESLTRRALPTQGWRAIFDSWSPAQGVDGRLAILTTRPQAAYLRISLPLAPVQSVTAVRYYDADGQPQIVASALYQLVGAPDKARLVFAAAPPPPGRPNAGVEIDFIAGYGAAGDTPQPLRQAILALLALWYENRGDGPSVGPDNLPRRVASLIAPYRVARLV